MARAFRLLVVCSLLMSLLPLSPVESQQREASTNGEPVNELACGPTDSRQEGGRLERLDPATIVKISIGSRRLEIPWAYVMPRPSTTEINCTQKRSFLSFQFWVPSLEAPEEDQRFSGTFRPTERRPNRVTDDNVVKVIEVVLYEPADYPQGSPTDRRIENLRRLDLISPIPQLSKARVSELAKRRDVSTHRWYQTTPNTSLLIRCDLIGQYPSCRGTMSLKGLRMDVLFDFPMDSLWRYHEIVLGIETLLTRWQQ